MTYIKMLSVWIEQDVPSTTVIAYTTSVENLCALYIHHFEAAISTLTFVAVCRLPILMGLSMLLGSHRSMQQHTAAISQHERLIVNNTLCFLRSSRVEYNRGPPKSLAHVAMRQLQPILADVAPSCMQHLPCIFALSFSWMSETCLICALSRNFERISIYRPSP